MASNQLGPSGLCPDVGKLLQVVGILARAGTECVQGGANVTVSWGFRLNARSGPRSDIDKQEFNLVPLDLKTFIDFYVFLLGIRLFTDFTLLRQP